MTGELPPGWGARAQDQLAQPFPPDLIATLSKAGRSFSYVPVAEYIARLNRVLGLGQWSYEVMRLWREDDFALAHVRITLYGSGGRSFVDGVGGQELKWYKDRERGLVDLGDDYKGAVSDAFKKACSFLGVGLDLARRTDEHVVAVQEAVARLSPPAQEWLKTWWREMGLPSITQLAADQAAEVMEAVRRVAGTVPEPPPEPPPEPQTEDAVPGNA